MANGTTQFAPIPISRYDTFIYFRLLSDYILLDTTPPTGTIIINNGALITTTQSVTLALTWVDGTGAGVTRMRFSDNGSTWTYWMLPAATRTHTLPLPNGYHTVRVQYLDGANNYSLVYNDYIKLQMPSGKDSGIDGTQAASDSAVALTLTTGPCEGTLPTEADLHDFLTAAIEATDSKGDSQVSYTEAGLDQGGGCAGCAGGKGTFTPDKMKKVLGDLFLAGLSLGVLQLLSRRRSP